MSSNSSTPAQSSKSLKGKSSKPPKSSYASSSLFTPLMQDAQARNKDPYDVESSDSSFEEGDRRFDEYVLFLSFSCTGYDLKYGKTGNLGIVLNHVIATAVTRMKMCREGERQQLSWIIRSY
jgi:hypothetical protein